MWARSNLTFKKKKKKSWATEASNHFNAMPIKCTQHTHVSLWSLYIKRLLKRPERKNMSCWWGSFIWTERFLLFRRQYLALTGPYWWQFIIYQLQVFLLLFGLFYSNLKLTWDCNPLQKNSSAEQYILIFTAITLAYYLSLGFRSMQYLLTHNSSYYESIILQSHNISLKMKVVNYLLWCILL